MDTSDNNAAPSASGTEGSRRRSGRVVKPTSRYSPEPSTAQQDQANPKRKRGADNDDDEDDVENEDAAGEEAEANDESDDDEDDDDDEEPTPKPKKSKSRAKKPATKRAKVNGDGPTGVASSTVAPAVRLPNRPKKTARIAVTTRDGAGIYGEHSQVDPHDTGFPNLTQ
jgi:cohesin complex subunit SA-1/2